MMLADHQGNNRELPKSREGIPQDENIYQITYGYPMIASPAKVPP